MSINCYAPAGMTIDPGVTISSTTYLDISEISTGSTYNVQIILDKAQATTGSVDVNVTDGLTTIVSGTYTADSGSFSVIVNALSLTLDPPPQGPITATITNNTDGQLSLRIWHFDIFSYDPDAEDYSNLTTKINPTDVGQYDLAAVTDNDPSTGITVDTDLQATFTIPSDLTTFSNIGEDIPSGAQFWIRSLVSTDGITYYTIRDGGVHFPIYPSVLQYIAGSNVQLHSYLASGSNPVFVTEVYLETNTASACSYNVSPLSFSFDETGGSGTISVATSSGCAWNASSSVSWVTIASPSSGYGNGSVTFSVDPNPDSTSRSGTITLGGEVISISQNGGTPPPSGYSGFAEQDVFCVPQGSGGAVSVSPEFLVFPATGGDLTLTITGDGSWSISSSVSWLTFSQESGSGNASVTVTASNNSGEGRAAFLLVNDIVVPVYQEGTSDTVAIYPGSITVPSSEQTLTFYVSCSPSQTWTPVPSAGWVAVSSGGVGPGSFQAFVDSNATSGSRVATIYVESASATIEQAAGVGGGYDSYPMNNVTYGYNDNNLGVFTIRVKTDEIEVISEDTQNWRETKGWKNIWEEK